MNSTTVYEHLRVSAAQLTRVLGPPVQNSDNMTSDRIVIAMGVSETGDEATQTVILRRSALKTFMHWLEEQIATTAGMETPEIQNDRLRK